MKKFAILLVSACLSIPAFSQGPFTITADNFPIFGLQEFNGPNASNGTTLTPTANGSWDMSSYHGNNNAANDYQPESLSFYTNAGVDVYLSTTKALTPTLNYLLDQEIDFNVTGVYDRGVYIPAQAYPLSPFTGNTLDSLTFPLQGAIFSQSIQLIKYPATFQSSWKSKNRRVVDFNLTVLAAGLNKTPSQHIYNTFRSDTVVGWGTLRVYANGGPSIPYPVLINKTESYSVDSFFVGGAPAPTALLNAFGITQGQIIKPNYRYSAYREGHSTALAILLYTNSSFTTPQTLYFDVNNLSATPVNTPSQLSFSTLLFPNPSSEGQINMQIIGELPSLSRYNIMDQEGRVLQSGPVSLESGMLHITLNGHFAAGTYILQVEDDKKQTVISELFMQGQ